MLGGRTWAREERLSEPPSRFYAASVRRVSHVARRVFGLDDVRSRPTNREDGWFGGLRTPISPHRPAEPSHGLPERTTRGPRSRETRRGLVRRAMLRGHDRCSCTRLCLTPARSGHV